MSSKFLDEPLVFSRFEIILLFHTIIYFEWYVFNSIIYLIMVIIDKIIEQIIENPKAYDVNILPITESWFTNS